MLIQEVLFVIRRWLWLLILGALVGGLFAYWSASRVIPLYQADAGVVVIRSNADVVLEPRYVTVTDDGLTDENSSDDSIQTLASIVRNDAIAESTYENIEAQVPGSLSDSDSLLGAVSSEVREGVIWIVATARNPVLASVIANEWADAYAEYVNRIYTGKSVANNLDAQVEIAKTRYEEAAEAVISNTREDQTQELNRTITEKNALLEGMLSLRWDTVAGNLETAIEQRQRTIALLDDARFLQELMRNGGSSAATAANTLSMFYLQSAAVPIANDVLAGPENDLNFNFAPKTLEDVTVSPTELNADLNALIAVLEDRTSNFDQQIAMLRHEVESAEGVQDDPLTKSLFVETDSLHAQVAEIAMERNELVRQRDLLLKTFTLLANEAEESGIKNSAIDDTVVRFAIPAPTPKQPFNAPNGQGVIMGMFAGLIVAIALAFLLELLDNKIRQPRDVEHYLALPTLASGPRDAPDRNGRPIALSDPTAQFVESMRYLRTALNSLPDNNHSLLITSVIPGDGKSSVAANLAIVIAQTDQSVVLVDANLRRPRLHQLFGIEQSGGLVDLFNDTSMPPTSMLQQTSIPDLQLLPAGLVDLASPDQLASKRMNEIISQLGGETDIVIIDSAAAGEVTDAIAIATKVDTTLLVLRAGSTSVGDAQQLSDAITTARGSVAGVFLNRQRGFHGAKWYSRLRTSRSNSFSQGGSVNWDQNNQSGVAATKQS